MTRAEKIGLGATTCGTGVTLLTAALGFADVDMSGALLWVMGAFGVLLMVGGLVTATMGWRARVHAPTAYRHGDSSAPSRPATDAAQFVRQFSEWMLAKRAALPVWPGGRGGGVRSDDPALAVYKETQREVERQARLEYHERFRPGVLDLLDDVQTEQATNPQTINDLEAVEQLLKETGR